MSYVPIEERTRDVRRREDAGYAAMHKRVAVERGQPSLCEHCGTTTAKAFDWASLTKNYVDIYDYVRLCRSCHCRMDGIKPYGRVGTPTRIRCGSCSAQKPFRVQWRSCYRCLKKGGPRKRVPLLLCPACWAIHVCERGLR